MSNFVPTEAVAAQKIVESVFAESVVGIYLFGSAVVGGLKVDSDVDVLAALNCRSTFSERKELVDKLMSVSGKIGNTDSVRPLELTIVSIPAIFPWRFPLLAEFVYGEWLRDEYERGFVPEPGRDPDLTIVLKQVIDFSITLAGREASELFEPIVMDDIRKAIHESLPNLLPSMQGDERNVILTLARMWFTASTGQFASKDAAAEWAENQLPDEQSEFLREARLAYLGRAKDNWTADKQIGLSTLAEFMKQSIEASLHGKP
jgi:streptomycin 3"-adenylyltransferase